MSRKLLLIILLLCSALLCHAQRDERTPVRDPLPGDTVEVNALIGKTYSVSESFPAISIEYGLTAARISRQLGYRKGEGRALGRLGWLYFVKGEYLTALENAYEGLKISEKIDDRSEMARCHNTIGTIDFEQRQYDKAAAHYRKGYTLAHQVNESSADSARMYAMRSLQLSEASKDFYFSSIANHTLGDLAFEKGDYPEALRRYHKALQPDNANDDAGNISESWPIETRNQIIEIYIRMNRLAEAKVLLKKNIKIAEHAGFREQLSISYKLMSRLNKLQGNLAGALEFQERYNVLHDSIYTAETGNRLAMLKSEADLDIKQAQIELLTKDTQLNKKEMDRQRTQLYAAIGGIIGILMLTGILIYGYQKIEHTNILLKQRTEELARINQSKDKLFSIISHDFRSPLNSLRGALSLLEDKHLTRDEFNSLAEKLRKNFNAVSNDLENLLHWSMAQLQGIQTHSSRIDVQPIVEEHIMVFQEIAKAKNVNLRNSITDSIYGHADADHIRLVLRNLINNAIKFTPPGGTVEISAFEESPFVRIQVSDTGVGIGTAQMEMLFQKNRSISTKGTNQEKGVGLGLLLCHEFVANNGGRLHVDSQPGKGSIFSFTLRVA